MLKNFEITPSAIVRIGVQLRFFNNILNYTILNEEQKINFNTVSPSIPLSFIYLFNNNNRKQVFAKPYLVLGGRYAASFIRESTSKLIEYDSNDVMADAGLGVHLYGKKKHILALELIYSKGFVNMKASSQKRNIYNSTIKDLYKQTLMLSLNLS